MAWPRRRPWYARASGGAGALTGLSGSLWTGRRLACGAALGAGSSARRRLLSIGLRLCLVQPPHEQRLTACGVVGMDNALLDSPVEEADRSDHRLGGGTAFTLLDKPLGRCHRRACGGPYPAVHYASTLLSSGCLFSGQGKPPLVSLVYGLWGRASSFSCCFPLQVSSSDGNAGERAKALTARRCLGVWGRFWFWLSRGARHWSPGRCWSRHARPPVERRAG